MAPLAGAMALIFVSSASARPPDVRYTVTPIGPGIGRWPTGAAVNNRGEVLLTTYVVGPYDSIYHPTSYLWRSGQITPIPSPQGARVSYAVDINDHGQALVSAHFGTSEGSSMHGYVLDSGVLRELVTPPGSAHVSVYAINNWSAAAGTYALTEPVAGGLRIKEYRPTVWSGDGYTDLEIPGGPLARGAYGINDLGAVVGSFDATPYRWQDGTLTALNMPAWASFGNAGKINNAGLVIGTGTEIIGYTLIDRPLLWVSGTPVELPLILGRQGSTRAINAGGLIVGNLTSLDPADSSTLGVLWDQDGVHDLNVLISPQSGWQLTAATDINDLGWITGAGLFNGVPTAFVLTPVPGPAGCGVLLLSACTIVVRRAARAAPKPGDTCGGKPPA